MEYKIIEAKDDPQLFIDIYNRHVKYAPYTAKLDAQMFNRHIIGFRDESRCLICVSENRYGIIHFAAQTNYSGKHEGMIYTLITDTNQIALELIIIAEKWFKEKKLNKTVAYIGGETPYSYILHGFEPYCWAGNYPANNAFNKMGYDVDLDVIVMSMDLKHHSVVLKNELTEKIVRDDDLAIAGEFSAYKDGVRLGFCGYHYLKAVSVGLNKKLGQINIWSNEAVHGTGLAQEMMVSTHNALVKLGVSRAILTTNQSLFRAVKFYEKLGYTAEPIKGYSYSKEFV